MLSDKDLRDHMESVLNLQREARHWWNEVGAEANSSKYSVEAKKAIQGVLYCIGNMEMSLKRLVIESNNIVLWVKKFEQEQKGNG